ncbi:MAG: hypothetical protein JO093_14580 [Acidobacteria bacterium]|nr:hypothetical protein [Acidobacteriota bacterium]MBV9186844.1 hypothetical protein [Acidobacteriota bacterium]
MKRLALVVSLAAVMTGCTTRYQVRGIEPALEPFPDDLKTFESDRLTQLDFESRSVERFATPPFTVGVIEFTDEGVTNEAQYTQVRTQFERALDSGTGVLLVIFAHGWHHSCRTCDRDLACFRRVLSSLAEGELRGRRRTVFGVYLGWRGASMVGNFDYLTLWNRKYVAEHIGRTGAKEVLAYFHEQWRRRKNTDCRITMITVGHSLGGAMVFSAARGKLTGDVGDIYSPEALPTIRLTRTSEPRSKAFGHKAIRARFGDLLMLVNPAIQASDYDPFNNDVTGGRQQLPDDGMPFSNDQLPVLVTFASTADTAVGRMFPLAAWISGFNVFANAKTLFSTRRRTGMGRYAPHVTHTLTLDVSREKFSTGARGCFCTKQWRDPDLQLDETPLDLAKESITWSTSGKTPTHLRFNLSKARHGSWDVNSPYLVIQTNEGVITEHSDIFNPLFVGVLRKMVQKMDDRIDAMRAAGVEYY